MQAVDELTGKITSVLHTYDSKLFSLCSNDTEDMLKILNTCHEELGRMFAAALDAGTSMKQIRTAVGYARENSDTAVPLPPLPPAREEVAAVDASGEAVSALPDAAPDFSWLFFPVEPDVWSVLQVFGACVSVSR